MYGDDRKRVAELYQQALDRPEPERIAWLEEACPEPQLRRAVLTLLEHYAAALTALPAEAEPVAPPLPVAIRHFQIKGILGEGGMGTVYLAEQQEPMVRPVALKVIRPGMAFPQVLDRFQAEQQVLAVLDHPAIARAYESGSTEDGRPYFAMEYVPGLPITEYCDRNRLDLRQRIDLFLQVCASIQFAHQKGIIHRDIKPSNVLVAESETGPVPKVIDFGIAKIMSPEGLGAKSLTQADQLVGTIEYMSPEQAARHDIDTRTDVYALGLLLYELLVGVLPFSASELRMQGEAAMLRCIREEDPARPSLRVSTLGTTYPDAARARRTEARSLSRTLRGDLDWIVMKTLEKDRERRYESPASLAADLRRHLQDQPIVARPPSLRYRARKFVRRHRTGVTLSGTILFALFAIVAISIVQGRRVSVERDRARTEASVAQAVAVYLGNLFHDNAVASGDSENSVLDLIDAGVSGMPRRSESTSPVVRSRLLRIFAEAYINQGQFGRAQPVIAEALAVAEQRFGSDHVETEECRFLLAAIYEHDGRFAEAASIDERVLPVFVRDLGPAHPRTSLCRWSLANLYLRLDRNDEGLAIYRQLLADLPPEGGSERIRLAMVFLQMGIGCGNKFDYDRGIELCKQSLQLMEEAEGEGHAYTILPLANLALLQRAADHGPEASAVLDRLEAVISANFGSKHMQMTTVHAVRGWLDLDAGDHASAAARFRRVLALQGDAVPDRYTTDALLGLGVAERELGHFEAALGYLARALALQRERYGDADPRTLQVLVEIGQAETEAGRQAVADSLLAGVVAVGRRTLAAEDPVLASAYRAQARAALRASRYSAAESLLLAAHASQALHLGQQSPRTLRTVEELKSLYSAWGRPLPIWMDSMPGR